MMKGPKYLLLLLAVLGLQVSLSAAPSYLFRRHTASGGLSSNTVRTMIQGRSGLIWIGTADGLDCFDGVSYHHYDLSRDAISNYVNCLIQDSGGELWAGTDNAVYHGPESGPFVRLDLPGMPAGVITRIAEDRAGDYWISTRSEGVFRYDGTSVTAFPIGDNSYSLVYADPDGTVWVMMATGPDYLYTYDRGEGVFEPASVRYENCQPVRVSAMIQGASGDIWMGTWDEGLRRYNPETRTVTAYGGGGEGFHYLHSLVETAPWTFLVGSDDGLLWYNVLTGEKQLYVNDMSNPYSLSNKFVYPLVLDREGGIWVGTYYGGINYASPVSGRFRAWSLSALAGATESYTVSCFCEGGDGTVWIGSDNGGLLHFDPETERSLGAWPKLNVQALCPDGDRLWVGTYMDGLMTLDRKGRWNRYKLDDPSIYSLYIKDEGSLWAGTMRTLEEYDPDADRFVVRYVTGTTTLSIAETPDGSLWFATIDKGLVRRFPDGAWGRYTVSDGLFSDRLNCLANTPQGGLCIGTKQGLNFWSPEEGFSGSSLSGTDVLYVVPDGDLYWLSTDKGVIRYSFRSGLIVTFGANDGILTDHFMERAGMEASDGRIYLGATDGFDTFYPERIRRNPYVPPVRLSVQETGDRSRLFHFAALSYCAPEKNRYSYILEGFDDTWHEMTGGCYVTYGYIPPGRYRFRVKGSNNDDIWNETGAEVPVYIRPHPLLSNLAVTLYVLLFAAGLFFLVRWLLRRSEQSYRKRYSEMLREQEKRDLDARMKFVTTIAHEIRTPLSLIAAPVERISTRENPTPEEIKADIRVIDRSSRRLIKLVNQILDFSKITGESLVTASTRWGCISDVVKAVYDAFLPTLEERGITPAFDCPVPLEGDCDEEMLTKMVSNLLSNALKYTRSFVKVSVWADGPVYKIAVADDGPGIRRDALKRIFQPFFRLDESREGTGLGLPIVKQMAESLGGSVLVDSTPGEGSTFTLRLPLSERMKGIEVPSVREPSVKEEIPVPPAEDIVRLKPVLLLVEDDDEMRAFLAGAFSDRYEVLEASDGERAKALLRVSTVSLVISDWMMPGLSGAELCQWMRSQNDLCHIPFIMLTAKTDDESVIRSVNSGADAHVKKPFSLMHLQALSDHLVEMRDLLARKYSGQMPVTPVTKEDGDGFIARLMGIIESNIANTDLSVDMLATEMCVSRSGLFSKVKEVTGLTPNNLIINARLKAAAGLLDEKRYSVNEVCYMVGFNSPSYFSKSFYRRYGLTPHQWMEKRS